MPSARSSTGSRRKAEPNPALDSSGVRLARPQLELLAFSVAAGLTAVVLGVIELERRSLWIDEALDVGWTELAWGDYLRLAFQNEASQALYLLLLKPWLAVASNDEWAVRAPSVVFAALAAGLLVPLGTRLTGSRLAGVGAGLLLATNAFAVSWSQQVRQYALAMLLAVVVTYLFVHALESEGWRWWIAYGVVAGISVYAHFFVALVLASHAAAVVVIPKSELARRWAAAAGLSFVVALPALDFVVNHDTGQSDWIPELSWPYVKDVVYEFSGESRFAFVLGIVGVLALLVTAVRRPRESWRYVLVASWLTVPFLLTVAISYFKPMLVDRFLIVALPALALASAYAISRLGRWAGPAGLAVAVAISLTHVRDWYDSLVEQDWRGAVAYVEREKQPQEQLLVHPDWLSSPVEYYAETPPATGELTGDPAWVISLTDRSTDVEQLAAGSQYRIADAVNFVSVQVWRMEK
jgi:mannosyltransferase